MALVPFAAYQIMLRAFYALADTRTPALISVAVSAATVAASLAAARLTHGGTLIITLAACSAVAYTGGLASSAWVLRRRIGRVDGHRVVDAHGRILVAATVAALAAALTARVIAEHAGTAWSGSLVAVCGAILAGAGPYAVAAYVLRVAKLRALTGALRAGGWGR